MVGGGSESGVERQMAKKCVCISSKSATNCEPPFSAHFQSGNLVQTVSHSPLPPQKLHGNPPPPLGVKFFAILQHPVALRQQCHCFAHMGTRLLSFYCLDFCHCLLHVPRFHCIAIRIHSVKVTVPPLYRAKRMQVFMRGRESRL